MTIFNLLTMAGGLALFLYGMNVMGGGLEKLSGGKLEKILEKLTAKPWKAVLLGAGVTALVQSSSATTVMVVGFVNSGIMKLSQAIGIIMGANVGTTMTSWILSLTGIESSNIWLRLLKPSSFTPVLAMIGIILFMAEKSAFKRDIGGILLGFAVLMFGMETMSDAVKPLAQMEGFTSILTKFTNPLLGVLAGALLTAVIQSSSASVGILQALSVTGVFTYGSVIPIILGQNIGTCITAILSAFGGNRNAKRTAAVHLFFNIIGAIIFLLFYYILNGIFSFTFTKDVVHVTGIALIHSCFNLFTTVVLFPFIKVLERLAYLVFPVTDEEKSMVPDEFVVLDERFLSTPGYAIEQCRTLMNQMVQMSGKSVKQAMELLMNYSSEKKEEVQEKEKRIDAFEDKLSLYLTRISSQNLTEAESHKVATYLHCITDIERISDHAINIVNAAEVRDKKNLEFSGKAVEELQIYSNAVAEILDRTMDSFVSGNREKALTIEPLEEVIDHLNKEVKKRHLKRLRKGRCTIEMGLLLSEIATDFERVADHCSNIALSMLQIQERDLEAHSYVNSLKFGEKPGFDGLVNALALQFALPER